MANGPQFSEEEYRVALSLIAASAMVCAIGGLGRRTADYPAPQKQVPGTKEHATALKDLQHIFHGMV